MSRKLRQFHLSDWHETTGTPDNCVIFIVEIRTGDGMMGTMEVRLLVTHPSAETKQIRLGAETLIGRGPECKLRISSGQVSRRHCLIKVSDATVSVRDLGSANGTRLNGQPISTDIDVPVLPGSTLVVGPLKFVVQFAAPRTTSDEDTELLSVLTIAAKSQQKQTTSKAKSADGEETKDYPPSQRRRRGAKGQEVVAQADSSKPAGPSPQSDAPAESGRGRAGDYDVSIDPGETIFDVSLEDRTDRLNPGVVNLGEQSDSEKASETHLLFEEDDFPPDDAEEQLRKFLRDA